MGRLSATRRVASSRYSRFFGRVFRAASLAPFRFFMALLTPTKSSTVIAILGLNALVAAVDTITRDPSLPTFINVVGGRVAIPDVQIYALTTQLVSSFGSLSLSDKLYLYTSLYTQVLWFVVYLALLGKLGQYFFMGDTTPRINVVAFAVFVAAIFETLYIVLQAALTGSGDYFIPLRGVFTFIVNYKYTVVPVLAPLVALIEGAVGVFMKLIMSSG